LIDNHDKGVEIFLECEMLGTEVILEQLALVTKNKMKKN